MPFLSLTKRSKQAGVQTFAKAVRLPEPMFGAEMEYLNARDWYVNQVGLIAQYEEALAQAKANNDNAYAAELGGKLHGIQSTLTDYRIRVKEAGRGSFAVAFKLAAKCMLSHDTFRKIEEEAERILGRPADELRNSR